MEGVYLVCTINEAPFIVHPNYSYERNGENGASPEVIRFFDDKPKDFLFNSEIEITRAMERHIKECGVNHKDHLALYRADGTLIEGGPIGWKDVVHTHPRLPKLWRNDDNSI